MNKELWMYVAMALLTAGAQASGAPSKGLCPAEIKSASVQLVGISSEWKSNVSEILRWDAATFLGSAPERKAFLKPETHKLTRATWSEIYVVGTPDADGNWIQCSYGEGGDITLAKRIDDSVRQCTVTYKKESNKDVPIDVTCR